MHISRRPRGDVSYIIQILQIIHIIQIIQISQIIQIICPLNPYHEVRIHDDMYVRGERFVENTNQEKIMS